MTSPEYSPHRRLSLRSHPVFNEKWLQQRIADDPALLGLGEVDVKDVERSQPRAGRLDLLLYDPESSTRYEVEIQLGATDESHIIRTIEYWDIERRRYPQYDHVAVIVAEQITARFFNVISLFNGFIPIIAIQVSALEIGDAMTLAFTTVLDRSTLAVEEEEEQDEPRDRGYWENKASPSTLALTDRILGIIKEAADPRAQLKYNKNYIGLAVDGIASNFMTFRPRRQHVLLEAKIPRSDTLTARMEEAGFALLTYQTRWGNYRIQISQEDLEARGDMLREIAKLSRDTYGSSH
jgi:hypothetical protein